MDDYYFLALEAQQGFVGRADVLALGFDDRFIRRQIGGGTWVRIRPGAYCFASTWRELDAVERHRRLCRAVLRSLGDGVVLSKVSGLVMRPGVEIWGIDLSRVHVTRRDGRAGSVERDIVHHEGRVPDDDVDVVDGLPVLSEARCVVETVATCGVEQGLVIADSALHARRITRQDLDDTLEQQRRWRGSRTVDVVLRLAEGKAESVGESRSRYLFWSQGLPRPEVQFPVWDRDGNLVGITDLAWPLHGLLFEFDGRVKYGRLLKPGQQPGDVVFDEKKREDRLRRASGCAVERAVWSDLSEPARLARRTRERMTWPAA